MLFDEVFMVKNLAILMFGRYREKLKRFWNAVVSVFLEMCVKDHGENFNPLPRLVETWFYE